MSPTEEAALAELEERLIGRQLSHREIAKRLGISHGTIQNVEKRALEKLRKLVRDGWRP